MAETFTKEEFWAKLDALGEDAVTLNIDRQIYGPNSEKRVLAKDWLRRKAQERSDASQAEQIAIARSAAEAAWEAAREAKSANTIAKLALAAATIAIAVSIIVPLAVGS